MLHLTELSFKGPVSNSLAETSRALTRLRRIYTQTTPLNPITSQFINLMLDFNLGEETLALQDLSSYHVPNDRADGVSDPNELRAILDGMLQC